MHGLRKREADGLQQQPIHRLMKANVYPFTSNDIQTHGAGYLGGKRVLSLCLSFHLKEHSS